MTRYLLDTNIISEPFKLEPDLSVVTKLQEFSTESMIASVSWHELLYGLYRMPSSRRKQQLETYLFQTIQPHFPIIPYDEVAAAWFAEQRAKLTTSGRTPSYADGQIAAIGVATEGEIKKYQE
ncbi:MAG: PIN domain-containing protein [Cyanobacteria bacterium P01_F01_bin.86]